ncbi:hypothetical protein AAZX31_04G200600 [Glycine max]|uniref:Uncharacterized protein n=2 Tax=Glycine subgen. Soja TaxID=1462606 RepID=I1JY92_SOYBN|nr:hypothetical protein JHK87_010868 [Glycine soja]KAG5050208.1 hypothetical protein JHK85_011311 [Glycine max]KAG5067267.1 hypothetical protein JHK86_010998 [Glycine max]KAH1112588.1 hypothetical protein GYH30_010721 [Glycine max]KAH1255471.1 hypothetical protein GmHk_04G011618 [Glycine max]
MEEVQRERVSAWNSYSPCHFMEQVVKAFSNCLGLYTTSTKDGGVTSTTSRAMRRPPKPPLSAGRTQINLLSS